MAMRPDAVTSAARPSGVTGVARVNDGPFNVGRDRAYD
jgi:hypothetical protein